MRPLVLALLLAACRITEPRTATAIRMELDASCKQRTGDGKTFALYVDGANVGVQKLSVGQTSDPWPITKGTHTITANVVGLELFFSWAAITLDVGREGVVYLMRCQ